jgi:hypothetical protein
MFKMPFSCKYHGNFVFIAEIYNLFVFYGTSGLAEPGVGVIPGQVQSVSKGQFALRHLLAKQVRPEAHWELSVQDPLQATPPPGQEPPIKG